MGALRSARGSNPHNKRFIQSFGRLYTDFLHLNWDEFIIAVDFHVPFLKPEIFDSLLEIATKYKIPNIHIPGDFWDQIIFSKFDLARQDSIDWHDEIKQGTKIIQILKSTFKNVVFTLGSHDIRFWLMMLKQGKEQPFDEAWNLTGERKGITVSEYRFANIGDEWRVTHPKNIVKIGSKPSTDLCAKFGRSLIIGHGHWWGIDQDFSAKHYLIYPGCMCDPYKISYKSLWDTSHREWKNGFVMVLDKKVPFLFDEDSARIHLSRFKWKK